MAQKKRPRGRPRFDDPAQVRRHYFTVRLNDQELELVERASGGGRQTSKWAREVLLRAARRKARD